MKNKKIGIMALILSLTMLCGCTRIDIAFYDVDWGIFKGIPDYFFPAGDLHNPEGVRFEDIEYIRPDTETLEREAGAVIEALNKGRGYFKVTRLLDAAYEDYYNYLTMMTVANVRSLHDLTDEYYAGEYLACSEAYGRIAQLFDEIFYSCADSPISGLLERFYFWDGFCVEYGDEDESIYNEESVELIREENTLISRYRSLISDPTVEWDGEERSYNELYGTVSDERYAELIYAYYEKYSRVLGELFIELVDVRQKQAEAAGYESYEQMQYDYTYSRDYTPEQAREYMEAIKENIVPLYIELTDKGEYDRVWEYSYHKWSLKRAVEKIIDAIGGDAETAMDFMLEYGMYDMEGAEHKSDMSFETYLEEYNAPFLFISPDGSAEDVMKVIHEMGHYTDSYVNYNAARSTDVSECLSMGLEYLSLDYLYVALDDETAIRLRRESMLDAVSTFAAQSSYAEFESLVYSTPASELTVEKLNEYSLQCAQDFGVCTEGLERFYAMSWIDIVHFFEAPLYVVSYTVSNDIALQFFALEQSERGAGIELYYSVMPAEYNSLLQTVEDSELESPFDPEETERTAALLRSELGY